MCWLLLLRSDLLLLGVSQPLGQKENQICQCPCYKVYNSQGLLVLAGGGYMNPCSRIRPGNVPLPRKPDATELNRVSRVIFEPGVTRQTGLNVKSGVVSFT
jgi:hypothetical protein